MTNQNNDNDNSDSDINMTCEEVTQHGRSSI